MFYDNLNRYCLTMYCIVLHLIKEDKEAGTMQSQLTVRLHDGLEKNITNLAKRLHLNCPDILRMALEKFKG